jgi:hypothetical protein
MDKTIRKYKSLADLDEVKADEYRYWQSRPMHERMAAVSEFTSAMCGLKQDGPEAPKLGKTLVRFERFQR